MNGDNRNWIVMTENEHWWQKMNVDYRKWLEMTGDERWG